MKLKKVLMLGCGIVRGVVMMPWASWFADPENEKSVKLETVTVTANKMEEDIQDVPQSITVVDAKIGYQFNAWNLYVYYRSWLLVMQTLLILVMLTASFFTIPDQLPLLMVLFAGLSAVSATQDIAADALAVTILEPGEHGLGNSIQAGGQPGRRHDRRRCRADHLWLARVAGQHVGVGHRYGAAGDRHLLLPGAAVTDQ